MTITKVATAINSARAIASSRPSSVREARLAAAAGTCAAAVTLPKSAPAKAPIMGVPLSLYSTAIPARVCSWTVLASGRRLAG